MEMVVVKEMEMAYMGTRLLPIQQNELSGVH